MLGGIMATDMRVAKAAYRGGCRIFEPNHPAMALQMGLCGATTMNEAEAIRHLVPLERMAGAVEGLRAVLGDDVFITVAARGTFTEAQPVPFTQEDAFKLAYAGADCLHTHKSSIEDVRRITDYAHNAGLLCEAYISAYDTFGVQAPTDETLLEAIHDYEDAGVDLLGLCTGMIYQGKNASGFSDEAQHRFEIFLENTHVVKVLEGGIKPGNIAAVKKLGFDVLVMSTALDNVVQDALMETVERLTEL
ncbi:MAG: histidine biosynthesis protein [Candidatus Pelethousia sp.]|nr:histidine biosynthesis protein [Candidatus Pelethousia sp.]